MSSSSPTSFLPRESTLPSKLFHELIQHLERQWGGDSSSPGSSSPSSSSSSSPSPSPRTSASNPPFRLREFQKRAIDFSLGCFFHKRHGVLLGHEMGLGKTVMMLSLAHCVESLSPKDQSGRGMFPWVDAGAARREQKRREVEKRDPPPLSKTIILCPKSTMKVVWHKWASKLVREGRPGVVKSEEGNDDDVELSELSSMSKEGLEVSQRDSALDLQDFLNELEADERSGYSKTKVEEDEEDEESSERSSSPADSHDEDLEALNRAHEGRVIVFHGDRRHLLDLSRASVVITTYSILLNCFKECLASFPVITGEDIKESPLSQQFRGFQEFQQRYARAVRFGFTLPPLPWAENSNSRPSARPANLFDIPWDLVLLDEIQIVKNGPMEGLDYMLWNRKGKKAHVSIANAVRALTTQSKYSVGATGTPIGNEIKELGAIAYCLHVPMPTSRPQFYFTATPQELQAHLATWMVRETKATVWAELPSYLPPKREFTVYCRMSTPQIQELSLATWAATEHYNSRKWGMEGGGGRYYSMKMLQLWGLMCQICHGRYLRHMGDSHENDEALSSDDILEQNGKSHALVSIIGAALEARESVVVFMAYTTNGTPRLQQLLRERFPGQSPLRYDSRISDAQREANLALFDDTSKPEHSILLCGIKCGGTGISLVRANHVVFMDASFNPANEWQAEDRVHRMGQSREVRVYRLMAAGRTVEKAIRTILHRKATKVIPMALPDIQGEEYHMEERQLSTFAEMNEEFFHGGGLESAEAFLKQYRETCRMDLADGEEFKVVETTGGRQSPGGAQGEKKRLKRPREEEEEEPLQAAKRMTPPPPLEEVKEGEVKQESINVKQEFKHGGSDNEDPTFAQQLALALELSRQPQAAPSPPPSSSILITLPLEFLANDVRAMLSDIGAVNCVALSGDLSEPIDGNKNCWRVTFGTRGAAERAVMEMGREVFCVLAC